LNHCIACVNNRRNLLGISASIFAPRRHRSEVPITDSSVHESWNKWIQSPGIFPFKARSFFILLSYRTASALGSLETYVICTGISAINMLPLSLIQACHSFISDNLLLRHQRNDRKTHHDSIYWNHKISFRFLFVLFRLFIRDRSSSFFISKPPLFFVGSGSSDLSLRMASGRAGLRVQGIALCKAEGYRSAWFKARCALTKDLRHSVVTNFLLSSGGPSLYR
jgi:hypothetical protein